MAFLDMYVLFSHVIFGRHFRMVA